MKVYYFGWRSSTSRDTVLYPCTPDGLMAAGLWDDDADAVVIGESEQEVIMQLTDRGKRNLACSNWCIVEVDIEV